MQVMRKGEWTDAQHCQYFNPDLANFSAWIGSKITRTTIFIKNTVAWDLADAG